MNPAKMICLIGEQPIPNLLPIRHYHPQQIALIYSAKTKKIGANLAQMVSGIPISYYQIDESELLAPFDLITAQRLLQAWLQQQNWQSHELLFNVTGGTKPMSLAAARLAERYQSPMIYLQSEGSKNWLYKYEFQQGLLTLTERAELGSLINIDDYYKVYGLSKFTFSPDKEPLEKIILQALQPHVDEIIKGVSFGAALEIDLTIRCGNQVGIAEVKTGGSAKGRKGLDQLNTAAQREYFGTFTKRFLIIDQPLGTDIHALATAQGVIVIHLLDDWKNGLSPADAEALINTVTAALGVKK